MLTFVRPLEQIMQLTSDILSVVIEFLMYGHVLIKFLYSTNNSSIVTKQLHRKPNLIITLFQMSKPEQIVLRVSEEKQTQRVHVVPSAVILWCTVRRWRLQAEVGYQNESGRSGGQKKSGSLGSHE